MRKKVWLCAAMVLSVALLASGLIPQISRLITSGAEVLPWKQNQQSDFVYTETFENYDKTVVRSRAKIDLNWKFLQNDSIDASGKNFDDSDWRLLNLPHDWSIEGEYDQANPSGGSGGYLPTGIGWYRKTLTIPKEWRDGRQVSIAFDGVFTNSTVYVDGEKVGGMEYGWLSFSCDITDQVQGKESVVIAVKVDNSVQPAARWYTGSGIYSHVWIVSTEEIHVAENGTYVTTPGDANGVPTGDLNLETVVVNEGASDASVSVRTTVYRKSDDAKVAQVTGAAVTVPAGKTVTVPQTAKVENPLLWNTETPNLYYLVTEILSGETVLDDYITEFGFRTVTYDVNGLYLNGEKIELKGVANHWALGAIGAAQSDNIIRYKIQMMKSMGVNCIRTAHNACPPTFYQLCNEMGMMVMDEFSEGERGKTAGDYGTRWFKTYWQRDFESWIRRDRNHPCVVVWSIGNETGSDTDNTGISAFIKKFDTSRPTTGSAIHYGVDIPGANGQSENASFGQPVSTLPLIATEAPHTHAVRGVYRTQTWFRGRFSETGSGNTIPNLTASEIFKYDWSSEAVGARIWPSDFDNATSQISVRKHWTLTRDNAWRVGEFRWTGFDYLGEANYVLGGWPYRMFHSGAVDTALFEKDMYYLYQSMWLDTPVLHILPSWTHPTMEDGTEVPVWVYSNCETVELFLNGVSLGKETRGPVDTRDENSIQFDWLVPYTAGTITAVGYDKDGKEVLRESYTTASAPAAITLENTTGEEFPADPSWVGQVTVTTVDKDGNFYPYGENRAYYYVSGPAYIKAADNGSPTDTESHVNYNRNAFMGLNKVFVCPTQDKGDILFTAASILGEKRQLTSDLVYIDVQQIALRGNPVKETFEIYYTLDGTVPSRSSTKYTGAFAVELGTTVKAAVYASGSEQPVFLMEEAFGENEGMYWAGTGASGAADNVYPADDAVLTGDTLIRIPYGYEESYVNFNNGPGTVEYTVNAPETGSYYVAVCYNNGSGTTGKYKSLNVLVNGSSVGSHAFYYNGAWDNFWSYHILNVPLTAGENKIKFDSGTGVGPNLKELILWSADEVYSATEGILGSGDKLMNHYSAFDDSAADVGADGGTVTWNVTDKPAGTYNLYFWYSTPNSLLREVSGAVNGKQVAVWAGQKTSPDYGSTWGYCKTEISLAPGKNVLTVTAPTGGTLIGAIVLEPVKEFPSAPTVIDSSCVEDLRLGASATAPIAVGTDVVSANASWDVITNAEGLIYLVNRDSGKLLTSDGTSLTLSDGETDGNAQWQKTGEAEHYDYLVHAASGKVLAVDADGKLILDARSNYEDGNMISNRAYWYFHSLPQSDFKFAENTPAKKTVDSKPFYVSAVGGQPGAAITYSVVSGPATVDSETGFVTLTGKTGTVVLKATVAGNGEYDSASVTHSITVTASEIAKGPMAVYEASEAVWTVVESGKSFKTAAGDGVTFVDFNNCNGSIDFTVNAPEAGEYYIAVGYNTGNNRYFGLSVNDTDYGSFTAVKNGNWYACNSYYIVKVTLKQGNNLVKTYRPSGQAMACISNLLVSPAAEWLTAADQPAVGGNAKALPRTFGFDGTVYDTGNLLGTLTWKITVPVSGTYRAVIPYASGASDKSVDLLVNDRKVTGTGARVTSGGYEVAMKFVTTEEFTLTAGEEIPVALNWTGGAYVSGVRLELVKPDPTQTGFDFVSTPNEMTYGDSVLLKAQGGQSGGKITYSVVSGPGTVDANGKLTATGAGTITVKAILAGNETYDPAEATVSVAVLPKKITVTAENKLKVYGASDPALTYKVDGLVGNDTLTGTLKYTGTDAGTYDIVIASGFENGNYDVTFVKGTMTITKKPITVTADNQTKVYGASDPALTYKVDGLVGNDTLTGTLKYTGMNVGTYDIVKDTGFENGNYDVTFVKGTMTVTKKSVTVTADNQTKVYGSADPTLTYKVDGLVGNDTLTGTLKYTGTDAGTYDIVIASGFENGNYDVTFVKGTMTVTKKAVTVTADNQTKVYGAADPTLTYKVDGLVGNDTLTGTLKYTGSNAGTYDIVIASGFENGNYDVTFVKGTMTITKKPITVTADNQTKVYGASDPALTYKVDGLVGNDTLTGTLKYTGTNVGTYDIVIASGFENGNYDVTFVKGTMTVTKKPVTVTADNQTKVYGSADPTLTYKVEGLVGNDTLTGTLKYTGSNVGSYDIVKDSGFENGNYDVTFVKGTMTITAPTSTDDSQGSSSDTTSDTTDADTTGSGSVTDGGASGSAGSTGTTGGGNPSTSDRNLLLFVSLISVAVLSVAVVLFSKRKSLN